MRKVLLTKHTTKAERRVYEVLKRFRLSFRHRWIIHGREVDFIVGKLAIEIDGHEQDETKNDLLLSLGYTPVHLHNGECDEDTINQLLITYKCLLHEQVS